MHSRYYDITQNPKNKTHITLNKGKDGPSCLLLPSITRLSESTTIIMEDEGLSSYNLHI